jgi:hypothetical protein
VQRQDTEERGADGFCVGGGEKGYQNGGEVVPCQGSSSE